MKKTFFFDYLKEATIETESIYQYFSEEILKKSYIIEFKDNEHIQTQDVEAFYLYYIVQGKAKIIKNQPNGKLMILQFLKENDFIGDLTVVGAEKVVKDVLSIGNTLCLAIPIVHVKEYIDQNPYFLKILSKYIGEKLLSRMDHFVDNQTYELKYRLAEVMMLTSVNGVYGEKHGEVAEYLGVSYRHLLHTIKFLKDEEFIYKSKAKYILNEKMLKKLLNEKYNS